MSRYLVLAALLLVGCAPPEMTFRIVGPATPEQVAALDDGTRRWNTVADAKHQMRLSAKADYEVSFPAVIPTDEGPMAGRECTQLTFWDHIAGNKNCPTAPSIRVRRDLTGTALYRVMLHELGHALGLPHIDVKGAVMHPNEILSDHPTALDVAECQRVGHCPRTP